MKEKAESIKPHLNLWTERRGRLFCVRSLRIPVKAMSKVLSRTSTVPSIIFLLQIRFSIKELRCTAEEDENGIDLDTSRHLHRVWPLWLPKYNCMGFQYIWNSGWIEYQQKILMPYDEWWSHSWGADADGKLYVCAVCPNYNLITTIKTRAEGFNPLESIEFIDSDVFTR